MPTEKDPKEIRENRNLIAAILKEEIVDFNLPLTISNVLVSNLGRHFDPDFTIKDILIRTHINNRLSKQKSRIIVYG